MALLSNWSETNREISEGKVVTYSKARIYGQWSYTNVNVTTTLYRAWEYHRYCQMSYAYVGLTYSAALACAKAVIANYTRATKTSEWSDSGSTQGTFVAIDGGTQLMASVSVRLDGGDAYRVEVQVREDDSRLSTASVSPSSLFSTENNRTYETGDLAS